MITRRFNPSSPSLVPASRAATTVAEPEPQAAPPPAPAAPSPVHTDSPPGARPEGLKSRLKKVVFNVPVKKEDSKTAYPVMPDANGELAIIAARIKERQADLDALEGALKTDKKELSMRVGPFYFTNGQGKTGVPSSVSVNSPAGEVLVTFANRYSSKIDENALLGALGADVVDEYFRQSFNLSIKGEALPAGKEQEIVDAVCAVLAKFNCVDALSVKDALKPVPDFHARRHLDFTPEENMEIEQVCPITAMVKTKGRGEEEE